MIDYFSRGARHDCQFVNDLQKRGAHTTHMKRMLESFDIHLRFCRNI